MGIKICGHKIRWQKPIKTYTLCKATGLVLMICALAGTPVFAAESDPSKASAGTAVYAPGAQIKPQDRYQRTAGTPSMSPALAIAMALGVRNVQGPIERRQAIAVRKEYPSTIKRQAYKLPGDGTYKKTSLNAAALRLALED